MLWRRKLCASAAVAQLVERKLPKLEVAGSRPVRRLPDDLLCDVVGRYGRTIMRSHLAAGVTLVILSLSLGACGNALQATSRPNPGRWLSVDEAARSATITLIASYDATALGYNLDGAVKGALLFTVPSGWRVTVRCVNNSSTARYSCALTRGAGESVSPPDGSDSPHPASGLGSGEQSAFSFVAGPPARYRLVALTQGIEPAGMWVVLQITRGGAPQVRWLR